MLGVQINPACTLSAAVTAQPLSVTLGREHVQLLISDIAAQRGHLLFSLVRLTCCSDFAPSDFRRAACCLFFVLQGAQPSGLYLERDLLLRDLTQPAVSRFRSSA